ncbi:MAG: hypothetical protein M1443_07075 [Nitrospirae bacterium]|nr:hypothetical protein [Nitrospirota bacterium]
MLPSSIDSENGKKMHKITRLRIGEIKKRRYGENTTRCSLIDSEAIKAGRFRSNTHSMILIETCYNYVNDLFNDILEVERNALKGRIFFFSQEVYFDELISTMRKLLLAEFKKSLDQQFLSTSSAYEAGRYQNPLKDLTIQKKIEEYSDQIHRLVVDTINSMREEFKQNRNKGVLKALLKIGSILKDIAKKIIGMIYLVA